MLWFFFLYFIRFVGYMLFYNSITCILTSAACFRVCAVSKTDIYCTFWNQLHVFPIITIPSRNLDVFLLIDRLMECSPCSLHMVSPSAPSSLSDSRLWRGFLYLLKDLQLSTGRKKIGLRQHEWSLMKVWREITVGRTFSLEWHSVAFWQAGDCRINPPALPGSPTSSCIWLTSKFKRKNKHFLDSPLKINDSISCCQSQNKQHVYTTLTNQN